MTPHETASKLIGASNFCKGERCIFASQCHGGHGDSCPMKEIGMTIRAQQAEHELLQAQLDAFRSTVYLLLDYAAELEKINKQYYTLVNAFQRGYRPPRVTRGGKPIRQRKQKELPKDPTLADGDERYAPPPPPPVNPEEPMVII